MIRCAIWTCRQHVKTPKEALKAGWGIQIDQDDDMTKWHCPSHLQEDDETDPDAFGEITCEES